MTTDNFNDEHAKFLLEYFVRKNEKNLPFCFHYISYKKGTDIITESQQYRLCLDLLDAGYKVYVNDVPSIISQVKEHLTENYNDKVVIGSLPEEEVFWINL
jgi:membrane-anchored protein YejM (alkaline phosphatase superfamily)